MPKNIQIESTMGFVLYVDTVNMEDTKSSSLQNHFQTVMHQSLLAGRPAMCPTRMGIRVSPAAAILLSFWSRSHPPGRKCKMEFDSPSSSVDWNPE